MPRKTNPVTTERSRSADFHLRAINDAMNQAHPFAPRPARMANRAARPQREWPHHRRHLRAHLHNSRLVWLRELCPSFEVSRSAQSGPLHHQASRFRAQEECRPVPQNAHRRFIDRPQAARNEILAGKLDAHLACGRNHVRLHVFARGASSRANPDAGAPAWLSPASQNARHLALGKIVEGSRPLSSHL